MASAGAWAVLLGWAVGMVLLVAAVPAWRRVPRADRCAVASPGWWFLVAGALSTFVALFLPWVQGISVRTGQPLAVPAWWGLDRLSFGSVFAAIVYSVLVARRGGGREPTDGFGGGGGRPAVAVLWPTVLCAAVVLAGNQAIRLEDRVPEPAWGSWIGLGAATLWVGAAFWVRFTASNNGEGRGHDC